MHRHHVSMRSDRPTRSFDNWVGDSYMFLQQFFYSILRSFSWQAALLLLFFVIAIVILLKTITSRIPIRSKIPDSNEFEADTYNIPLAARPVKRKRDRTLVSNQRLQYVNGDSNTFTSQMNSYRQLNRWRPSPSQLDPDTFTAFKKRMSSSHNPSSPYHPNGQYHGPNQKDNEDELYEGDMNVLIRDCKKSDQANDRSRDDFTRQQVERLALRSEANPLELSPLRNSSLEGSSVTIDQCFESMPLLSHHN